jgi:hypothetical protein
MWLPTYPAAPVTKIILPPLHYPLLIAFSIIHRPLDGLDTG